MLTDAALVADGDTLVWVGTAAAAPACDERRDLGGRAVVPGFVDSHMHLVFAGDRSQEFAARMAGVPYDGGGIATTVAVTRAASDDDLRQLLGARVAEMRAQGTTTVEIKSGYGLTVADETRALRLASAVSAETTFLGGHVVPPGVDRADYVRLVCGEMLTACAPFARWVDVFCEPASPHAFTEDEARAILLAGRNAGLKLRVHGNQLSDGPGVQLAVELCAASVDHCTHLHRRDVEALTAGTTVATLLPGVEFLHPFALPGRAPAARRGRHGRAGHRLQSRFLLHLVDAVRDRPGGTGDGHDTRRGALDGDRRRRPVVAARRPRDGRCGQSR